MGPGNDAVGHGNEAVGPGNDAVGHGNEAVGHGNEARVLYTLSLQNCPLSSTTVSLRM